MTSVQEDIAYVRALRDELYRIRAEKPGSMYATDAYIRYMREASARGMNPTQLREHSRDEVERFFAQTVQGPDGHVYWNGGRAFTRNDGADRKPGRWWWEHVHGEIGTTTLRVRPTCGDDKCINPEHAEIKHFVGLRYTHAQMVGSLQVAAMRLGHAPSTKEWDNGKYRPVRDIYIQRFGSWAKALAEAGLRR